jgi:hypothetical protein
MTWPGLEELVRRRKGHFTIAGVEAGWLVTIHRRGQPVEKRLCASQGHANQVRQVLTDEGLLGFVEGAP